MSQAAFELYHPAVPAVLFCGIVALSMLATEPVCTAILLAGALSFAALTQGLRAAAVKLRWQLPLLALICLVNPVFSAVGSTLVARVGPLRIYAESLAFGATMGALLVSVLVWIEGMGLVVGQDELLSLSGGMLPSVTLAVSMTAQLTAQLMGRARTARTSLRASCAAASERSLRTRVMGSLALWSLEDSLERSDAMRARAWGATRHRTRFRTRPFRRRDALALVLVAALIASAWAGEGAALARWDFYPRMGGFGPLWAYVSLAALASFPSALVVIERVRWRLEP